VSLVRSSLLAFVVSTVGLSTFVGAQVFLPGVAPGQARDTGVPQQPTERRVPVGTSSITGTVVAVDTGRPVKNARVSLNGQVPGSMNIALPGRGGAGQRGGVQVALGSVGGVSRGEQVAAMSGVSRSTVTDASGQFSFPRLPAGQYQLSISHNQYLQLNYGQRRFGGQGTYVQIVDGQQFVVKAAMQKGGVIVGTVLSAEGEPLQGVQVRGWRYTRANGFKRLQTYAFAQTDDRGLYRMFNLQPGDYVISAMPNVDYNAINPQMDEMERAIVTGQILPAAAPGSLPTVVVPVPQPQAPGSMNIQPQYLHTFAPNSPAAAGATVVTVAAGEERTNVDVITRLTQATTIQVELASPLENGVTVQMQLVSDDPATDGAEMGANRPDQSGRVFFRGVRPGKYTVVANTVPAPPPMTIINGFSQPSTQPPPVLSDAQKLWARVPISVDGDPLMQLSVTLQAAKRISGAVVFDMPQPPDLTRVKMTVMLQAAPAPQTIYLSNPPQAQVGPDGRFTLTGVSPGRYVIRASGAGVLRSVMSGGQEILDFPLDVTGDRDVTDVVVTMAAAVSELTGTLTDNTGKPAPDYTIVVASSDSRYWMPGSRRIAMTRPGPEGRYAFRGLPPGQYFLAAVVDPEQGVQYDPDFLKELSSAAIPITIDEGGKLTQDVRVK